MDKNGCWCYFFFVDAYTFDDKVCASFFCVAHTLPVTIVEWTSMDDKMEQVSCGEKLLIGFASGSLFVKNNKVLPNQVINRGDMRIAHEIFFFCIR